MKIYGLLIMLFFLVSIEAKSQGKPFFLTAKVQKLDTTDYYLVVEVTLTKDKSHMIVLSPMDHKATYCEKKDSSVVKLGKTYRFYIQPTDSIKSGKNSYFLLHFQNLYWGGVLLAQEGKYAYIAMNMFKGVLYR